MRTVITYIADDETEFDNEEECIAYENGLKTDIDSVIFFDERYRIMHKPSPEEIEGNAFYMKVLDAAGAERLFDYISTWVSFEFLAGKPIKDHYYRWLEGPQADGWIDFTREIEILQKTMAELMVRVDKKKEAT